MSDPPVQERLDKLLKARDIATALVEAPKAKWENGCEDAFHGFRLRVVHLRKEREALDSIGDKDVVWRFICKFSRTRPFMHDRCTEVLKILMLCPGWMKAFTDDPECSIGDLPPEIKEDFDKRLSEVREDPPKAPDAGKEERRPSSDIRPQEAQVLPVAPGRPAHVILVVQRCSAAKVVLDEKSNTWGEIGQGLVVSISFALGATEDRVRGAARFILTAKLSIAGPQSSGATRSQAAESVVALAQRGEEQGIVVMPQSSLASEFGEDLLDLRYDHMLETSSAEKMYNVFVEELHSSALQLVGSKSWTSSLNPFGATAQRHPPKIVACAFSGRQLLELSSVNPFMHSLHF